ncbi:ABC transporter substrate-binding protein [Clostridium sp. DJ247]|uniref:ABC transporter substrate-binding protein n=1 Tax=Clostridium sp. DJ247 TaxID=2726188 RepID=UPI0016291F8F|nr:extracellular solute-binding protein [Clostridium sp. DJ247]MBC2579507.1 extracellular solute-binding protein [Clostridium sp. DJ247]
MNKRLKKLLITTVALTLMSTLFTGCGSAENSTDSGKVKLEIFSNKPENQNILQSMIDGFEKENPNIKITFSSPPNAGTVLKTRLVKNDIPDILSLGGDISYSDLSNAKVLLDLSNENFLDQIQKPYIDMTKELVEDNKLYGIPYATNADGVLYNKDLFEELGLQIPKTWDELIDISKKIQAAGKTPFYFTFKELWVATNFWNVLAGNLQPNDFAKDRKNGKTTFASTHDEVVDKILELIKYGQEDILGVNYNDGNSKFAQGKAVMYIQGNWAISDIKKSNPKINLDMFPLPVSNDTSKNKIISGIDVLFSISNKSKHPEEAKKFILYMIKKENAQKYINDQFAFSAVKDVFQQDATVKSVQASFKNQQIETFQDHYYPSGFNNSAIVQELFIRKNKMEFLKKMDIEYDRANDQ